ncbi:efflux transporter outer membrane subunit [Bradyrhizobium sp. Arg237L]|uniref:efflux transporter outer membrane subunit n=1 Tax=Bradyrhizobium sp. Arg237L TaxID=3003352 RepID=UPI00249F65D9|nr:efflux transporter outer membrane subunit [Bradyrhizobium sp. Arg237L]MDI4238285.1 efflux transporter outer membrane subunit [Bradyrhizobium sp. Arg237L]
MSRFGALLLVGSTLSACAVGPDYDRTLLSLPAKWGNAKAASPKRVTLSRWWNRLGDPILDALIEEAVQNNLDVASAKARIREARATRRQAIGGLLPLVDGFGLATSNRSAASSSGSANAPFTYNQFQAGFDASWELDLFGANRRAVEAATYGVDAAEDDMRSTLVTLVGDVTAYYVEMRGYQARIALARRAALSQRQTALLTQQKFEAGSASAVDAAKAAGLAASTESFIPTYEVSYAEAVHRIGVLLGREPTALAQTLRSVVRIPAPRLPLPTGIPADVLVQRPDVRSAERRYAQSTAKIGQAEAALYPRVSLTGSVSTTGLNVGDIGKGSSIGWSVGPSVSVPIFNGGRLRAAVDLAEAQRDQYYLAWRASVLTALEDVENALVALAQERIKIRRLSEASRRYGEAARLSRALYASGSTSFLESLDAERSFYTAEDGLIVSRVAIATSYIALAKALGGGWDGAIDSSVPTVIDVNTGPHMVTREPRF